MSEEIFRGGLGLFWSSKVAKMTKCCLVCIRVHPSPRTFFFRTIPNTPFESMVLIGYSVGGFRNRLVMSMSSRQSQDNSDLDEALATLKRSLMSGAHVRKLNRALHEIKKLKARIRDLQQHSAMPRTQADTADTGFVLDSDASMNILKRKKWLRRILNRHRVIVRDAAGNPHQCDETGPLCMRIRTRHAKYHDLPDMRRCTIMRNAFHNLFSISALCRNVSPSCANQTVFESRHPMGF